MSITLRKNRIAPIALTIAFAGLGMTYSATASTYTTETLTCPVGGEKFERETLMSNSTFGARPDGKPYSTAPEPFPIAECPRNHLLILDDFTADELARLPSILSSADYAGWIANETQYYRAAMLVKILGRSLAEQANMMRLAVWETDDDPIRRTRYLSEYIVLAESAPPNGDVQKAFWQSLLLVNAERELGRFEPAMSRLTALSVPPAGADTMNEEQRRWTIDYLGKFRQVIANENSAIEPLELIPDEMRTQRCVIDDGPLSVSEAQICASAELEPDISEFRQRLIDFDVDAKLR